MLNKRIIPCLDVMNGQVVKGRSFIDLKQAGDPVLCQPNIILKEPMSWYF